ncbi:MAG: DMT family transporter [Alicyclobacillus sp.]|nr:DMT family transporter [Alicyclobacillus sp.]
MNESFIALFLVVLSGLIHSVWNLFAKRSINKAAFLWFCQWAAIMIFLPLTVRELATFGHPIPQTGLIILLVSVTAHGVYVLLLAKTYSRSDLSQAYPIMRGTSPLLVPLLGVFGLGERLSLFGWMGVVSIVTGILLVGNLTPSVLVKMPNKNVLLAFCVGLSIAGYTALDKVALRYVPPLTLNEASNVGNLIALSWTAIRSGGIRKEWRANWKTILLGGVMAPGGYILFLEAMRMSPVAQVAPMREIGIVFGTLLGVFILRESQARKRIGASMLIVLGVVLLNVGSALPHVHVSSNL